MLKDMTLKLTGLQKHGFILYPCIHFDEKVAGNIGFGPVIKLVLKFKNAFWQKDAGFILSDEALKDNRLEPYK